MMFRGGNEPSRAEPDVNRPGPVIKKRNHRPRSGPGCRLFSRKKPRPAKNV